MAGKFIVFDGLPGSGKSTMIKKSFSHIFGKSKKYDNILITDEPTNGPFGAELRSLLAKQKSALDFAGDVFSLFVKDRKWHVEEIIKPSLERGFVVLCDRYKYSSIAYQSVQGTDFNRVFAAHKDFLSPDLALVFDVEPSEALRRMGADFSEKRRHTDKLRSLEFVSSLRPYFKLLPSLLPKENIHLIDANPSAGKVFSKVRAELDKTLF